MSTYICQPEHIGLLATWSAKYNCALRELENGEPLADQIARVKLGEVTDVELLAE